MLTYLAENAVNEDPMTQLLGHYITYRSAVGCRQRERADIQKLKPMPTVFCQAPSSKVSSMSSESSKNH